MGRLTTQHWLLIAGCFASAATIIAGLPNWHEALAPAVIAGFCAQIAIQIRSLFTTVPPASGS